MDTSEKYVTVDTNLYQDAEIIEIGSGLPYVHVYTTQITESEVGKQVIMGFQLGHQQWGTPWGEVEIVPNAAIPSVFTIGASTIGGPDVIARDGMGDDLLKEILRIATNGSYKYPDDINSVSHAKHNQLNDALILQAHCNRLHHILVSDDFRFFGTDGRRQNKLREDLEKLCNTRLMSSAEFKAEYQPHMSQYSHRRRS